MGTAVNNYYNTGSSFISQILIYNENLQNLDSFVVKSNIYFAPSSGPMGAIHISLLSTEDKFATFRILDAWTSTHFNYNILFNNKSLYQSSLFTSAIEWEIKIKKTNNKVFFYVEDEEIINFDYDKNFKQLIISLDGISGYSLLTTMEIRDITIEEIEQL